MITATDVWDNLDEWSRTVQPTAPLLNEENLTDMLAEMYGIEELDPGMPKQPHIVDEYGQLKSAVRSWLDKAGPLP